MKGFGFIVGDDCQDVYLHVSACVDGWEPNTGDYLSYDVTPSKKQPQEGKTTSTMEATNVAGGSRPSWKGGKGKGGKAWGGKGWGGPYDSWDMWGGKGMKGYDSWDMWGGKGKGMKG